MPEIHSIHSSGSVHSVPDSSAGKSGQNGSVGARSVCSQPESTQTIPKHEKSHREAKSEDALEGVEPSEGRQLVGGSPEGQLNRLITNEELAECYKMRAKDMYYDASLFALSNLKNFVEGMDSERDTVKTANDFKKSSKAVLSRLKNVDGANASDLRITIHSPKYGHIQLIPFNHKAIEPGQLAALLSSAMQLTQSAVQAWRDDPNYPALKEKYSRSIAQHGPQIGDLLDSIPPDNKEAFSRQVDLLQWPNVQIQFGDGPSITIDNDGEREPSLVTPPDDEVALKKRLREDAVNHYRSHQFADPQTSDEQQEMLELEKRLELQKKLEEQLDREQEEKLTKELELEKFLTDRLPSLVRLANGPEASFTSLKLPDDDGAAFFRGVFALSYKNELWINADIEEVMEQVQSSDVAQSIKFVIDQKIGDYLERAFKIDGKHMVADKLKFFAASADFKSKIFTKAFAHAAFSHRHFMSDLAALLEINPNRLSFEEREPCLRELRELANMIYSGVLKEFKVPESDGSGLGLCWQDNRYMLMLGSSSSAAEKKGDTI